MYLSELLRGVSYTAADPENLISHLSFDVKSLSDRLDGVEKGGMFFAVKGDKFDATAFCREAEMCGAEIIVSEEKLNLISSLNIITPDIRKAMAVISGNFFRSFRSDMRFIGVTGTNGKTTVTTAIFNILRSWGKNTALVGTVENRINERCFETAYTTPTAITLHKFLNEAVKEKCEYVVMEVSSHALSQDRVFGIKFDLGVFTNITAEHTDYHKTFTDYKTAKFKLFSASVQTLANLDSEDGKIFWSYRGTKTFSLKNSDADYYCSDTVFSDKLKDSENISSLLHAGKREYPFVLSSIGEHNLSNCLAAFAAADIIGVPDHVSLSALKSFVGASGRMERIYNGIGANIIIDYAHTPDALEALLKTARRFTSERLIVVFGCGGDRDSAKRPVMGKIAEDYADFCIVTSDNPRTESPERIITDILSGMEKQNHKTVINRYSAIRHAIFSAEKGDSVIISGKGHEKKQIVSNRIVKLSDKDIILEVLKELKDENQND